MLSWEILQNLVAVTHETFNTCWMFERYLVFREYQVSCADFLQYFILYLSILLELLSNYILMKLRQKVNYSEIAKQNVVALKSIGNSRNGISGCLTTTWFSSKNCSVKNNTRKLFTLLYPYYTRVLSNYILVELW